MNNDIIPKFVLAAQPMTKFDLEDFFVETPENVFFEKLRNPSYLRYAGWNLLTLDYPKIRNGTFWEVKNGDRKTIRLFREGSLIAVADATQEFLGWNSEGKYTDYPKLFALALIEFIYEFVSVYQGFLERYPKVEKIVFKYGFSNIEDWEGKRLILKPQEAGYKFPELTDWEDEGNERNQITKSFLTESIITLEQNSYRVDEVAFKIVADIFNHFNIPTNQIPYTKLNKEGQKVIDYNRIQNLQ